jgi:hypothetical protein
MNEVKKLELLPGAVAQHPDVISCVKWLRNVYGLDLRKAVNYARRKTHNWDLPYVPSTPRAKRAVVLQEQIDTLEDLQRQMLDILDGLKDASREIEREHPGIAARLDSYVIAHIECAVTSAHSWLDSSTSIDSIVQELEDEF